MAQVFLEWLRHRVYVWLHNSFWLVLDSEDHIISVQFKQIEFWIDQHVCICRLVMKMRAFYQQIVPHYWFCPRCHTTIWRSLLSGQCVEGKEYDSSSPYNRSALTRPPLNKMAAIRADDIFKCIFLNENDWIPIMIWGLIIIYLRFRSQQCNPCWSYK